jgi:hypothetical protein
MIANCWRCFAAGIVLMAVGDASLWCAHCTVSLGWHTLGWYVWFLADSLYALAAATQVAALERARTQTELLRIIAVSH